MMAFTYDTGSARGQVRLLMADTDFNKPIFEDAEVDVFLTLETDVLRAAAMGLETIASSQVMTLKVIKLMELQTDGSKVSAELRARAKDLRDRALTLEAEDGGGFDVIEEVPNQFAYRERVWDEFLRERE
jgi:hypothetical protein